MSPKNKNVLTPAPPLPTMGREGGGGKWGTDEVARGEDAGEAGRVRGWGRRVREVLTGQAFV